MRLSELISFSLDAAWLLQLKEEHIVVLSLFAQAMQMDKHPTRYKKNL